MTDTDETQAEAEVAEGTIDGNKVSITFERKVSDGDYGTITCRAWLENELPANVSPKDAAEKLGSLFRIAKVAVFDELGITYHYDTEANVIREDLATITANRAAQAAAAPAKPNGTAGGVLTIANPEEASSEPLPEWIVDEATKDGVTRIYDRRLTRDAERNQPWFVEAVRKGAQGHGKDGKAKSYWPPKAK